MFALAALWAELLTLRDPLILFSILVGPALALLAAAEAKR